MIKIFHPLLCYFPSQAGGPANTLYWLNNALYERNYQANVLSTCYGLDDNSKVELDYGKAHKVKFIDSKGRNFIKNGLVTIKESDIIQFSSLFFPPTLPLLIAALWHHKKVIISSRGELYPSALAIKSVQKNIWLKFIKAFQRKIFFHATNEYEKEIIVKEFPSAAGIEVIPNFIELPEKIIISVNENQLLFMGRINPIKNIDILLNAIAIIKRKLNKNIKLLIAGEARLDYEKNYFLELKELILILKIESNVTFLGHIEHNEKQKLLASSYALILPSKSENFGNVVIEALAQGTPVIASKNTPWEILGTSSTGYYVEGETEEIIEAITKIRSLDLKEYNAMRIRAYNLCRDRFDISSNIHHWENFYKKISI